MPAEAEGTLWRIEADLDGVRDLSPEIHLIAPHPHAEIESCGVSCTVAPGAALSLVVTAPEGIRTTQALALGRLGNLPLAPVTVTLVDVDHVAHTITGRQPLVAPASPGTWTLDVSVLGYHADQTIQLSVQ